MVIFFLYDFYDCVWLVKFEVYLFLINNYEKFEWLLLIDYDKRLRMFIKGYCVVMVKNGDFF